MRAATKRKCCAVDARKHVTSKTNNVVSKNAVLEVCKKVHFRFLISTYQVCPAGAFVHKSVHDKDVTAKVDDRILCLHWGHIQAAFVPLLSGNTWICQYNPMESKLQILFCLHLAVIQRFHLPKYCLLFALISAGVTDCTNKYQLANSLVGRNPCFFFSLGKEPTTFRRKFRCFPSMLLVSVLLFDLPSTCFLSICHFLQLTNSMEWPMDWVKANLE